MSTRNNACTLYAVRHPETEWNVEGRFQGHSDSPVTEKGEQESAKFVSELTLERIHHIYHAHNGRTECLAQVIAERYPDAKLHRDSRLNERHGGEHEGKLFSSLPALDANNPDGRFDTEPPGGESYRALGLRVENFLAELRTRYQQDETVICVTSSGVIRILERLTKNLTLEQMFALDIPNLHLLKIPL